MRIHFRNYRDIKSEMNIIPLLDILLIILLIFMITTPISLQTLKVDLPNSKKNKSYNFNNDLLVTIEISDIGHYAFIVGKTRIDQIMLNRIITEAKRCIKLHPKTVFLIGADKHVPYNEIIKVLDLLRNIGVDSVNLITKST